MSFITGLFLIDAPASALNNAGSIKDEVYGNKIAVKAIRHGGHVYPYVSAQAFRYWLRATIEANSNWESAPIYREEKVAYTDANPILYWDDDLFGYMRAPSKKSSAVQKRDADESRQAETPTTDTVTRVSPFRVSTLVAIAPANLVEDWESMSRLEGNPIPYSSQFYRATLQGLFSLDLHASGTFTYVNRTGFRNLDDVRVKIAEAEGLTHVQEEKAYRLSDDERLKRISALLDGFAQLEGGAKQTLHYTDVAPPLAIMAVTKGGNHIFGHAVGADKNRLPVVKIEALEEALTVFQSDILSDVYVGWTRGYLDEERAKFETWAATNDNVRVSHPREAFLALRNDLQANPAWLA